jgi:hypothetical protein
LNWPPIMPRHKTSLRCGFPMSPTVPSSSPKCHQICHQPCKMSPILLSMESDNRRDSLEINDLRRLRTLAWHARGQGFKSPILHSRCGPSSRSGAVQNSAFRRLVRAPTKKLAEKPGENHQKSRGNWRQVALFRGPKRHFRRARSRPPSIASRHSARPYVGEVRLRRAASGPRNRQWGAIFSLTRVRIAISGSGGFDDYADLCRAS